MAMNMYYEAINGAVLIKRSTVCYLLHWPNAVLYGGEETGTS